MKTVPGKFHNANFSLTKNGFTNLIWKTGKSQFRNANFASQKVVFTKWMMSREIPTSFKYTNPT